MEETRRISSTKKNTKIRKNNNNKKNIMSGRRNGGRVQPHERPANNDTPELGDNIDVGGGSMILPSKKLSWAVMTR